MYPANSRCGDRCYKQEQQRVAVVNPETRISFVFARRRPTQTRYGVDSSVGLNYTPAARVGTVVYPGAAAAAASALLLILH